MYNPMSADEDQATAKVPTAAVAAAGVVVAEAALDTAHYYLDEATTQADQARSAAGAFSGAPLTDSGRRSRLRTKAASAAFLASEHAHTAIAEVLDADRILADLDNTVSTAPAWEIVGQAHREAARAAEHMASAW